MSFGKSSRPGPSQQKHENINLHNQHPVWDYFTKVNDGNGAKCSMCNNIYKITNGSYKGVKTHLASKHNINIVSAETQLKRTATKFISSASTSTSEPDKNKTPIDELPPKKQRKIDSFFKNTRSMETMVSRMVSRGGYSLNSFCADPDMRFLFSNAGFQLPKSPNTIRSIVMNFENTVKADMVIEFDNLKSSGQKFSISFDEWTSQHNHRYLNINLHSKQKHYNLGLVRIHGSCTAEHAIGLVKDRLQSFSINLESDVIAMTTDGASVMVKIGRLVPCFQQLCFAHGIQLAVVDVIYKKWKDQNMGIAIEDVDLFESDTDDGDEDCEIEKDVDTDLVVTVNRNDLPRAEEKPGFRGLVEKVRKVVKLFRKSPTKYDTYLQKYVIEETGKELALLLDCRTRWNSLLNMLERFYKLKNCVDKALIDIKSEIKFSDSEWSSIKNLVESLEPFKLAVEALCRREATLLTAETSLKFILDKLDKQSSCLSVQLSEALRMRINGRRSTVMTGILVYLCNPKKYDMYMRQADETFPMPKKNVMRMEMKNILERVISEIPDAVLEVENEGINPEKNSLQSQIVSEANCDSHSSLTLKEELEKQILEEKAEFCRKISPGQTKDLEKILKKEMSQFEADGKKGLYLNLIQDYMMCIKPTSVEAERAFSAAGYICNKLRTRLGDKTINSICFLRSYFGTEK